MYINPKTDLDDELRALWAIEPPLMQTAIMERLGIRRSRLMRMVARLGLPDRAPPPPAPKSDRSNGAKAALAPRRKLLTELWQDTLTRAEIAELLGISEEVVRSMAGRMHLPPRAIDQPVRRDFAVDFRTPKQGVVRDHDSDAAAVAEFIARNGVTRPGEGVIDVDTVMTTIRRAHHEIYPRGMGEYRWFVVDGKADNAEGRSWDREAVLDLANRCRARKKLPPWGARHVKWKRVND